jgi:hypothetical protein
MGVDASICTKRTFVTTYDEDSISTVIMPTILNNKLVKTKNKNAHFNNSNKYTQTGNRYKRGNAEADADCRKINK